MHLLPSRDYTLCSETFDIVRTLTGYRVSVKAIAKRVGERAPPCLVAWFPRTDDDADANAIVDEAELLCEIGGMITDEELAWYRNHKHKWTYTLTRASEDVSEEVVLCHTWTVPSHTLYVPLHQPNPNAPLPVTTINIHGGHGKLVTTSFKQEAKREAIAANACIDNSYMFTWQTRPVHDLVETGTTRVNIDENPTSCVVS